MWSLHALPMSAPSHRPQACIWAVGEHVHSEFTSGVNVSVNGCLLLCVSSTMNWQLVQDASLPEDSQDWLQRPPPACYCIKQRMMNTLILYMYQHIMP